MTQLESMSDFFTARVEGYDEHMLSEVEGCKEGYQVMADLVPKNVKSLLDLGCGTGLELDEIFKRLPDIAVTGVDLTQSMLDKLREKHPDKKLHLICGDYLTEDFGREQFDCCVSFQTMHHFSHEKKIELYQKICSSLTDTGCYIECDYMVETQEEENFWFAENQRIRREQHISEAALCHYDTPCTIENQITMLQKAGFTDVKTEFRMGNTTILTAVKESL